MVRDGQQKKTTSSYPTKININLPASAAPRELPGKITSSNALSGQPLSLSGSFVPLAPSSTPAKVPIIEASNKKLSQFKMAVAIDDEGNLFRCVDAQTRRVTVIRIEVPNNLAAMQELILFLSRANHPYVMRMSTFWNDSGYTYFEMPFYSHCTLRDWLIKQNPTPGLPPRVPLGRM